MYKERHLFLLIYPFINVFVETLIDGVDIAGANRVKQLENTTKHDVKAVEYYLKEQLKEKHPDVYREIGEYIHFGCTSEDINNVAYGLMIKDCMNNVINPALKEIVKDLVELSRTYAGSPMLSRTHGQPATPTTFGKELSVFIARLNRQIRIIEQTKIMAKFSGAVGNYNCHMITHPNVCWDELMKSFITNLGLEFQPYSTQIECHDYIAELGDGFSRVNTCLLDLCADMWMYISRNMLLLKRQENEVGSSTMPHKVNPIDFENAEGNLHVANALFKLMSSKLPISRLQRDLSDSTVLRNIGVAFGHCMIAYTSAKKGLGKLHLNEELLRKELFLSWEVLAEPIQMIMRKNNIENSYEELKSLTRGQQVDQATIMGFIESLKDRIATEDFESLQRLTPDTYVGLAPKLARYIQ